MSLSGKTSRGVASASVCLWAVLACANGLGGCLGSGGRPAPSGTGGGDAFESDAPSGDALAEAEPADGTTDSTGDATLDAGDATVQEAADDGSTNVPQAQFSSTAIDFGPVGCGTTPPASKALTITNSGGGVLAVSASLIGTAFALSPTSLMLPSGMSGILTVTATVPASSAAGAAITGSMALFTNDPSGPNRVLPLSVTPSGATLTGISLYAFASSEVGVPAPPAVLQVKNSGNAAASFAFGTPSDPSVTINAPMLDGGITLDAGDTWNATASFTPTRQGTVTATSSITATGIVCGTSMPGVLFTGQGATGSIAGWPSNGTIDFGPAPCGGAAPAPQTVTLTNGSTTTDALVTTVNTAGLSGFTTDAKPGVKIPAGGTLAIHFTAPPVPKLSSLGRVTGTLVFQTDADKAPVTITLAEEPQGAILAFDTSATPKFGSFGTVILLQSAPSQSFKLTNTGNISANVTLTAAENSGAGGGADASADGGSDATVAPIVDAGADAGIPAPFSLSTRALTVPPDPGGQQDAVTFQPVHANATNGTLAMTVDSQTPLCAVLPAGLPLSGNAIGGGPVVTPTALTFQATCGGDAPGTQTFVVSNAGTVNLNWTMSAITGAGAGQYTVTPSVAPGLLIPGASSTITVTAKKIPSPAPNPNLAALAAQLTIDTDVPFDPSHVVTLSEVPLGDQLGVSVGNLRFGQVPINTSIGQNFTITNGANPGSPDSNFSLSVISGLDSGATAYTLQGAGHIGAGGSSTETVTFDATKAGPYPATVAFTTTDALCTPLPTPIVLSGTGTGGALSLSAVTLAFGTDPTDAKGLVNCGAKGPPHTLTLSNVGNQTFNVTGLTLGKGASSPFALSGPATTLPANLTIGAATTLTITPSGIPATVADPNDAAAFSDTLSITTDAAGDTAHVVKLVMEPYGVVIASTPPVQTAWSFGTISAGSIGTYTSTIRNIGNAPATVALSGLTLPTVFGLQNNPTTVKPNDVAALVGQFSPPSQDGTWSDQGQLVVAAASAFCQPLPTQWATPNINLSGSSNANPFVTVSGSPVFPTTDCGNAPPGAQSVKLTNSTNQAYAYTVKLGAGTWYTLTDANAGTLAANGVATIVVNPKTVTPGPGVLPGSAPYGDDLLIELVSAADAGTQVTSFTVPISWTLNGAVFSLADGSGPGGQWFYVADSTSGFELKIDNSGTASASVDFAIQPSGAFVIQPAPPIEVIPNVRALPELVSTSSSAVCPATTSGTATFVYSGPVCQPIHLPSVNVQSCFGTAGVVVPPPPPPPSPCGGKPFATSQTYATGLCTGNGNTSVNDPAGFPYVPGAVDPSNAGDFCCAGACGDGTVNGQAATLATTFPSGTGGCTAPLANNGQGCCVALVPCTTAGQTGCVQCQGNDRAPNANKTCTPTEAAIVQHDIAKGVATAPGADPAGGCYTCLYSGGCIDDTHFGDVNHECEDSLTTGTAAQCQTALSCIFGSDCAASDVSACYCGTAGLTTSCQGNPASGPINGACDSQIAAGLGFPLTDGTDNTAHLTDITRAAGMADQVFQCALTNGCTSCQN